SFYYQVSDGQGGLLWDSASVQLLDVTPPTILSCASNTTIFTTVSNCLSFLPDLTINSGLVATDTCSLTITQSPPAGTVVGLGVTPVTIYAVDGGSNVVTCTAFVTNRDNVLPIISCTDTSLFSIAGQCYALAASLIAPPVLDNCSILVVSNNAAAQLPVGTN